MSVGSMSAKNLTGTVDKAYILLHNRATAPESEQAGNGMDSMFSQMSALGNKLSGIATNVTGQESGLRSQLNEKIPDDFIKVKVQYNPSTVHYSSRGGQSFNRYSGVGGEGSGHIQTGNIPTEVVLNMDLIFDDTDNSDAFMMDSGAFSPTGIMKKGVSSIIDRVTTGSFRGEHSVQNISELFIAATTSAYSRIICVIWNKTVFWGELCGVNVEYTMFNSKGNPIRSRVHLEVRQDDRGAEAGANTLWNQSYQQMFKEAKKISKSKRLTSSSNLASNLFNFS